MNIKLDLKIGQRLTKLLETHNMTQQELAEALGVSAVTVFYWCKGTKNPRMDKVDKIAELFGVSRSYILGFDVPEESEQLSVDWRTKDDLIIENSQSDKDASKQLTHIFYYMQKILSLSDENKHLIFDYIDFIAGKEKNGESK